MMFFRDVVGQEEVISKLVADADKGTVPHALLFRGREGTGKMQTALAFARYLLCNHPENGDACGRCPSCVKMNKLIHPDLHFVFPVINRSKTSGKKTLCDDEMGRWREFLLTHDYFGYDEWLEALDADNKQAMIYTEESEAVIHKLQLTSSQGGYKVVILWKPEKMHITCANKLLKLLEEPAPQTVFILVSDNPEQIIDTIVSRTQSVVFLPVPYEEISRKLQGKGYMLDARQAIELAHLSDGSWLKALQTMRIDENSQEFLNIFIQMMRLAYGRKLKELFSLVKEISEKGREWQKNFLTYSQRLVRENFINNLNCPELTYMTPEERAFSSKFSPFVNERNIEGFSFELSECQKHIEQNVNPKMVFMDFFLKLIMLLKQ